MNDTHELITGIVNRLVTNFSIDQSRAIIRDAILGWATKIESNLVIRDGLFEKHVQPVEQAIRAISLSSKRVKIYVLTHEWCDRVIVLRDKLAGQYLVRSSIVGKESEMAEFEEMQSEMIRFASSLALDDALNIFARLSLEWAKRINLEGFDPGADGYKIPDSIDYDTWATSFFIWTLTEELMI